MNDLELFTNTMDKLNVHFSISGDSNGRTLVTLEKDPVHPSSKVPYHGYLGFAYIFVFDDGKLIEAGGYE